MAVISGTGLRLDRTPASDITLRIDLLTRETVTKDGVIVPVTVERVLDATGRFSVDIEPSSSFTPEASYKFTFINIATGEKVTFVRLVPDSASDFDDLREPTPSTAASASAPAAPAGGSGLTTAQVNTLIRSGVYDWAEAGNSDPIPPEKLTNAPSSPGQGGGLNQAAVDARVKALVENYAEVGTTSTIPRDRIADDAIDADKIAPGAVGGAAIADDSIENNKLADNAVDTQEIANNAVTEAKIAGFSVGEGKIKTGAVTSGKLANDSVVAGKLKDDDVALAGEIVTLLGLPSGNARLDAGAIKNLPTGGGGSVTVTPKQDHFTASRADIPAIAENTEYQVDIASDGATTPFAVSSNRINIEAGAANMMGWVDFHLDVDPTDWVSGSGSGGNRLFLNMYFKKNGAMVDSSEAAVYIRGDEDWAPGDHLVKSSFAVTLTGGDYLEMFFIVTSGNKAGAEIRGVTILDSDVSISTVNITGGGGMGGTTTLANGSVDTAKLADGAVTNPKLGLGVVEVDNIDTVDTGSLPIDWRRAIGAADKDIIVHADTEWTGTITGQTVTGGIATGAPTANLALPFTAGGETATFRRFYQDSDSNDLTIVINGSAIEVVEALRGRAIEIDGVRFLFDHYKLFNRTEGTPPIEYVFAAPHGVLTTGANSVSIYEPITSNSYVPKGRAGRLLGWSGAGVPIVVDPATYITAIMDNRPLRVMDRHAFALNRGDWRQPQISDPLQTFVPSQTASNDSNDIITITARLTSTTGTASQITLSSEDDRQFTSVIPMKEIRGLTAYSNSTAQGIRLDRWHFYEGSDLGGTLDLYIGQTGAFVAGLFLAWVPSGVTGLASRALVGQVTASAFVQPLRTS